MKPGWWWLIGLLFLVSIIFRHNLLFLMSVLLALLGGASYLWGRYCLAEVSYQRRLGSQRLYYGEETALDVQITNAKPLPLPWLRAGDECPDRMEIANARLSYSHRPGRRVLANLLSLRWYERVTRHYRLRATHRGAWQFGPVEIAAEDIFGFTVKTTTIEETQTVVVYPKIVPLTALGFPAQHPFGDFKTAHRVMEDPLRLMGVRQYVPGDNIRYMHWKASARRMEWQTKVFEPSASRPVAIFLNINTFEHLWEGIDRVLEELAITTAASIARYAWDNGYPLGLYVNSVTYPGGERIRLRPSARPDQLMYVLEALARVVEYGRFPFETVIDIEAEVLPYGTTCVVVTALLNERLRRALLDLRRREHVAVLVTLGDRGQIGALLDANLLPGVVHHHVGGREVWHGLESLQLA